MTAQRTAVVIGAGLAGLTAALRLRQAGLDVTLVTKGIGGLQLGQGTVDVFGYNPERVTNPLEAVSGAGGSQGHPYSTIGVDHVREAATYLAEQLGPDLLTGSVEENAHFPTAVGAIRPTALYMPSMEAGRVVDGAKFVIVGPRQLKDFYPSLVAGNLNRQEAPGGGKITARSVSLSITARKGEVDTTPVNYARALDDPRFRQRFADAVKKVVEPGETIGLPAVLGLDDVNAWKDIQGRIGAPVFEIPLPPPSVPGMRLNQALTKAVKAARVRFIMGAEVLGGEADGDRLASIRVGTTGHDTIMRADEFIYAPGGFESGSLTMDSYGMVHERAFDLPLVGTDVPGLIHGDYWGDPQPLFEVGVAVDSDMRVLGAKGSPVYSNLRAAGGILAGCTRWEEKSGDGIAIGSAIAATNSIMGGTHV